MHPSTFISIRECRFVTMMPVGDKQRAAGKGGGQLRVNIGVVNRCQAVAASHLIAIVEYGAALFMAADEVANLAIGIAIEEIERAKICLHCSQSLQSLFPGTGSRALVGQNNFLRPVC